MKNYSDQRNRIKNLQQKLVENDIDCIVIEDSKDLFYFTGYLLSRGSLWVGKVSEMLFVDGRYIEAVNREGSIPGCLETPEGLRAFVHNSGYHKVAFNGAKCSVSRFEQLQEQLLEAKIEWNNQPQLVDEMRMIKDAFEIGRVEASCQLLSSIFLDLQVHIRVGISEKELACKFSSLAFEKGADHLSFDPIIAFGENTAFPHHRPSQARLEYNMPVLIDIGIEKDGYASDMTRVLFIGEVSPMLHEMYKAVRQAHKAAIDGIKKGVYFSQLDHIAREELKKYNMEKYFTHSLGHGIGLDVHEIPAISSRKQKKEYRIEEGITFSIEPGVYIPGVGGVRYEDTLVYTKGGVVNFFKE